MSHSAVAGPDTASLGTATIVAARGTSPLLPDQADAVAVRMSIVIPCLNEAGTIGQCVAAARRALTDGGIDGEVIVVDNDSDDGADFVVGNRMENIHPGAMPWLHRYIGNPLLSGFLNLLFRTGVDDAHCGMRALRRSVLERLDLRTTGMEFASEMVIRAAKEKLDVRQFAIDYYPRGGESKLSSGFGALADENPAVLAATLVIIGIEIFVSSFLLSILGLRRRCN